MVKGQLALSCGYLTFIHIYTWFSLTRRNSRETPFEIVAGLRLAGATSTSHLLAVFIGDIEWGSEVVPECSPYLHIGVPREIDDLLWKRVLKAQKREKGKIWMEERGGHHVFLPQLGIAGHKDTRHTATFYGACRSQKG